jgi:ketosteroid isomerase-like protein
VLPTHPSIDFITQLEAEHQIRMALLRYFRGVDRKDFDLLASAYHDDAYCDHGTYKGDAPGLIAWVRDRHESIDQSMHFEGNSLIEFADGKAFVETYAIVFQHGRIGAVNLATQKPLYRRFTIGVRYIDRFEKRANQWKIAHRTVVYEWTQEELADLNLGEGWEVAKRSRDDMVFRNHVTR